jgi:hypothetical protein
VLPPVPQGEHAVTVSSRTTRWRQRLLGCGENNREVRGLATAGFEVRR